jgi:hypothetical protein
MPEVLGVDFNAASQREVLDEIFPRYVGDYACRSIIRATGC